MSNHKKIDQNDNASDIWKAVSYVTLFGVVMAACAFSGYYLGSWLGKIWGGGGIWIAVSVLASMGVGVLSLFFIIKSTMVDRNE